MKIDSSNIQPRETPVIVQQVVIKQKNNNGEWEVDKTTGILQNPNGRFQNKLEHQ